MSEVPSRRLSSLPPAGRVERWVLPAWILAIVAALLWALLG